MAFEIEISRVLRHQARYLASPRPRINYPGETSETRVTFALDEARDHSIVLSRTATPGPELDIVRAFLDRGISGSTRDTAISVFCEPRLETGFPDIVVVHWSQRTADTWPACRADFTTDELRLLHFIAGARCVAREDLRDRSNGRKFQRALDRLAAARAVKISSRWVRGLPLCEIFAVRRIIAIEAKISSWRQGLRQAFINTWFASESYLLLPRVPNGSTVVDEAKQMGIGVVCSDRHLSAPELRPRRERLPKCYASWLFNEWAWRGLGIARS